MAFGVTGNKTNPRALPLLLPLPLKQKARGKLLPFNVREVQ